MIIPSAELAAWKDEALQSLYWDGIIKLPWIWPDREVATYQKHMRSHALYNAHVKAKSDGVGRSWDDAKDFEVLSYDMADTIPAPHFFYFAVQFTDIVGAYLKAPPHMYSLNAFWTRPGKSPENPDIQLWHRDRDDSRFIALFMYGTDINSNDYGPHLYGKGSHRNNDGGHHPPNGQIEPIYGKAGTAFLEDPSGLHMGIKPREGERLLAWARWCVSDKPQSYVWDALKPVPASKIPILFEPPLSVLESTNLVVDWNS